MFNVAMSECCRLETMLEKEFVGVASSQAIPQEDTVCVHADREEAQCSHLFTPPIHNS